MKDSRLILGGGFIVLYYATLWVIGFHPMPELNVTLIKDAMLQLGPPIGIIIGAIFRTDHVDEKRVENSGKALDAINALTPSTDKPDVTLKPGQTAQAEEQHGDAAD